MLTEIEHKVASLLDNCKDQVLGDSGATQQEAEALSLKLKTVKCNLEKVQLMLQEKYSEDQVTYAVYKHVCRYTVSYQEGTLGAGDETTTGELY